MRHNTPRYYPGYEAARARVREQSLEEDLKLLDDLFGRDALRYGDSPQQVKAEALRQLEIEWRNPEWEREWGGLAAAARTMARGRP